VVGGLNKFGNDYWDHPDGQHGTRRGAAIDIYVPAEDYLFYLPNIRISTNPERYLLERHSGVSYAAAVVTGVLAMMWNANPGISNEAHVQILLETADDLVLPNGDRVRRVNAYEAVKQAYAGPIDDPSPVPVARHRQADRSAPIPRQHAPQARRAVGMNRFALPDLVSHGLIRTVNSARMDKEPAIPGAHATFYPAHRRRGKS
jgi:hypothetical protein